MARDGGQSCDQGCITGKFLHAVSHDLGIRQLILWKYLQNDASSCGLLQTIAFSQDRSADMAAGSTEKEKKTASETAKGHMQVSAEVEFKGSYTEATRRCALNILKVLGRVPYEEQLLQLGPAAPVLARPKSKLRRFLDYQTSFATYQITTEAVTKQTA